MTLSAQELAATLGLNISDTTPITTLLTDSRDLTFPSESVFFALRTAGNDGHNYIKQLAAKGVKHFVVSNDFIPSELPNDCHLWRVDDPLMALQTIAKDIRARYNHIPVIGITGSRGKTIVKELLFHMLSPTENVAHSPRSYNSQIGVPLSVWTMEPSTTIAIFEAGISQPGEMQKLADILRPTVGVFTSITDEHGEGFDSMQQKTEEKALLFTDCPDVFYPAGNGVIAEALMTKCPNSTLHAIVGDNMDMAKAVAKFVSKSRYEIPNVVKVPASPRIDVTDTLKDCLIVYDGFTNDFRSVLDALGYASRHTTSNRTITVILDCPICQGHEFGQSDYDELIKIFMAKGVKRFIGINFPKDLSTPEMERANSVEDFINRYTISDFRHELILIKGETGGGMERIASWLEAPRHETIMEVDLGAIVHNFNYYRSLIKPSTGLIAMVKAAGYGVGALELAKTMQNQGAAYLAVAVIDEGAELRRAALTMPIIVMNPISTNYKALFDNRLEPSVFSIRELNLLIDNARRLNINDYPVHIKLDTGMHRLGFLDSEIDELTRVLASQSCVKVASIFSHLATADCLDQDEYTLGQLQAFDAMSSRIMDRLPYRPLRHILNTAGIMRYPQYQYDMVRLGIGLYGISPIPTEKNNLQVVARLLTTIISIKHWQPGTTIGYGRKGVVQHPSIIATIPIGYADGLDRHLSNGNAYMIVNGHKCPIIGNICMDQCMIDVTEANAAIGDKVEVFGENAPIQRLSDTLETIPYEILTSISPRVKRIYYKE